MMTLEYRSERGDIWATSEAVPDQIKYLVRFEALSTCFRYRRISAIKHSSDRVKLPTGKDFLEFEFQARKFGLRDGFHVFMAESGVLSDKVALITGSSSGLGRAISLAYAAAGARIVCADLSPDPPIAPILATNLDRYVNLTTPTDDLVNSLYPVRQLNGRSSGNSAVRAVFVRCEVTQSSSVEGAVKFVVASFGRLDILVNNAGISDYPASTTVPALRCHETPEDVFDAIMKVNTRGVWLGCKYATGQMLRQTPHSSGDRGWIINISSILGLVGLSTASSYGASKGAVTIMTKSIALEYAQDRIHVNAIHPGFIETAMLENRRANAPDCGVGLTRYLKSLHPWGRLGDADEIAQCAVFLASNGASFITGSSLVVDGGFTAQ